MDQSLVVEHVKSEKEFSITLNSDSGEKNKAVLQYDYIKPNVVDLYHTEVPPIFRGKGVAKNLAKAALDHFINNEDVKIQLSCTYLQKYVKDNPKPEYTTEKILNI